MDKNKSIAGIGIAVVLVVIAGGLGMGCIGDESADIAALQAEIAALRADIEATEDLATEQAFLDMIAELQAQIAELEETVELPITYIVQTHTTTEFNESFSAWGPCGRGEHHIKDKALERAEDFADNLSLDELVSDIKVTYDGREREWLGNNTDCYITYFYLVEWVENEYNEEVIIVY